MFSITVPEKQIQRKKKGVTYDCIQPLTTQDVQAITRKWDMKLWTNWHCVIYVIQHKSPWGVFIAQWNRTERTNILFYGQLQVFFCDGIGH